MVGMEKKREKSFFRARKSWFMRWTMDTEECSVGNWFQSILISILCVRSMAHLSSFSIYSVCFEGKMDFLIFLSLILGVR